jgi:hypothetical protein
MPTSSYESAWRNYRAAIDDVRTPDGVDPQRGGGQVLAGAGSGLERVLARSQELRTVLSDAVASPNADLRDVARLKLLASAAYDLALAEDIVSSAGGATQAVERSSSVIFSSRDLKDILDAPLDATAVHGLVLPEREAFPANLDSARGRLRDAVEPYINGITDKSARSATAAIAGALNFGLGPMGTALSAVTQEVLTKLPEGVSAFVRYAAQLIQEAVRKLWAAFGESEQEEISDKTKVWFNELIKNKDYAAALLGTVYGSARLKDEVIALIDKATLAEIGPFKTAAQAIEELSARHARIMKTLEWVVRAVGWAKTPLMAAPPWGPLAAYAIYGGVLGYTIYLGGDYLDADGFGSKWLDHVVGLRALVRAQMTGA